MRHVSANTGNSVCGIAAAVLTAGALVTSAPAVTVTSDGLVVFRDSFENDIPGALPAIGSGDVGTSYTRVDPGVLGLTDIENDPAGELGQVLSLQNDAVYNGAINLDFPPRPEGSALEVHFLAKVADTGAGGSLGVGFTSGICGAGSPPCPDHEEGGDYVTACGLWNLLQTGLSVPGEITPDDVVVRWYDCSGAYGDPQYHYATVRSGIEKFKVDGGANTWVEVRVVQTAAAGSRPVFIVNGTVLDPLGFGISPYSPINGVRFRHNGPPGHSYVAGFPTELIGTILMLR